LSSIPYDTPPSIGHQFIALVPEIAAAILLTLKAGWVRALSSPDVHANAEEIPITERLRDGMRAALREEPDLRRRRMIIAPGTESRSRPHLIRPDGRTDIPVYVIKLSVRLGDHDPHAIIECKRVSGDDAHLCREYVVEGIDRFRTGKYGVNHAVGFMVGYLLSGEALRVVARINAFLCRNKRQMEQLTRSDLMPLHPEIWRSSHSRDVPHPPIELHHVFLTIIDSAS
jgi:hypothetical protein